MSARPNRRTRSVCGRCRRQREGGRPGAPPRLSRLRTSAKAAPVLPLHLALEIAVTDLTAAVPSLLAAGQGQLHLRPRALEVDPGGDQGQAAALAATDQALDLVPVKEQLAGSLGIMIGVARGRIGRDVGIAQPHLALLDHRVGVSQLRLALPQRLHLGADELDSALEPVKQLELVSGPPIGGHVAGGRLSLGAHGPSAGIRSTRPRGASTEPTRTATGSPRRRARPLRRPTSAVSVWFRSYRSSRISLTGINPSYTSPRSPPKRTNAPAPITPEISPSKRRSQPDSKSSRPSRNVAQTRSASRSIAVASRSRSELRQPASLTAPASGSASPAPIADRSPR